MKLAFNVKRPLTGKKPRPIEEMQRFISMKSTFINYRGITKSSDEQN